jgi:spore germination protein GerM
VVGVLLMLTAGSCGDDPNGDEARPSISADAESPSATEAIASTAAPGTAATTTVPDAGRTVAVYLLTGPDDCGAVVARPRSSTADDLVADALTQLLAGPTAAEAADGLTSWFSADTEGMLRGVVVANGIAEVSFDPALRVTIPGASSSCGSAGFMSQLDATILQFGTVDSILYSFEGDVASFYEWLQAEAPATE